MMDRKDPRWLEHAQYDPVLARMLKNPDMPLDRETYLDMAYMGDRPKRWTPEHESQVPEPFQIKNAHQQ